MKICRLTAILTAFACPAWADEPIDYTRQIKPILQSRCYACHGVLKREARLRLDTAALGITGGKSGSAIKAGDPAASLVLERVTAKDEGERMPPEGEQLSAEQIKLLAAWIAQGAKAPADEQPERDARGHWSFRTPVRPGVPAVAAKAWVKNPIDAFLAFEHEIRLLTPQPPADKRVWLRRVTIDLTGLPPTRAELDDFVADTSSDAEEKVITRLLESPHYGERWGRHWMDIWRYSDPWGLGADLRNSQKQIWHWRDWIIESLNADKGYDQMLREMLAADELYPEDFDRLRATGFLARQYYKFNRTTWLDGAIEHTGKAMLGLTFNCAKCHDHKFDPFSQVEYYKLRAIFEPYQVRMEALPGQVEFDKGGFPRAYDCNLDVETWLHIRGDDRNPDKSQVIEAGMPAFLSGDAVAVEPVKLPATAWRPGLRPFVAPAYLHLAERKLVESKRALESAMRTLAELEQADSESAATSEKSDDLRSDETKETKAAAGNGRRRGGSPKPTTVAEAKAAAELARLTVRAAEAQPPAIAARAAADAARFTNPQPENVTELARTAARLERVAASASSEEELARAEIQLKSATGEKTKPAQEKVDAAKKAADAAREALGLTDENYSPLAGASKAPESNIEPEENRRKPFPETSTGRRSAFARWLTDPKHPLPARVAVNHIWARHFGKPLVATVFDFGRNGAAPTHPALLDWLAVELIESGWSMKHIHRLIVTSNAYRMSSSAAGAEANFAVDPENRRYWRMNPVRMEAQVVRDSLLSLAGTLDLTMGGPPVPVADESSNRRSLYFVHSHNDHQKFLEMFDDANVTDCYRRIESIVPQQALALENSELPAKMASRIRERLESANPGGTDRDFLRAAFLTVLAIEPTPEEQAAAAEAFARLIEAAKTANRPDPVASARTALVHALLNHNDFVTVR